MFAKLGRKLQRRRIVKLLSDLDLKTQFESEGRSYVELDKDGNIVEHSSKTCVVVNSDSPPWYETPDLEYEYCGKPVVGHRADFPMCEEHMKLFDPKNNGIDESESLYIDPTDPPDAPKWMSHEAAYGYSCGWTAGYLAALNKDDKTI